MKKKIIALALIFTLLLSALLMCACDDNESTGKVDIGLKEGMSEEEILSLLENVTSVTTESEIIGLGDEEDFEKSINVVKVTPNGYSYNSRVIYEDGVEHNLLLSAIYEDNRLYQFAYEEEKWKGGSGSDSSHSVQEVSYENFLAGNFTPLEGYSRLKTFIVTYLNETICDLVKETLYSTEVYQVDSVEVVEGCVVISGLSSSGAFWRQFSSMFKDFNNTKIDIPEQYKDYKSLDLTE